MSGPPSFFLFECGLRDTAADVDFEGVFLLRAEMWHFGVSVD